MWRTIKAGVLAYLALAVVYLGGVLVTWVVADAAPFDPGTGDVTGPWVTALLLNAGAAGLVAGWVCRRVGRNRRAVAGLIGILVGLAMIVVVTEMVIGPTAGTRAFAEELVGPVSADLPFSELLQGRPQPWFVVASYLAAIVAIGVGARFAEKDGGA